MINDRLTARVLGAIILIMTFLIDVGCFMFTKPEIAHRASFPLVVLIPSLPMVVASVLLFRRAKKLKIEE